MCGSNSFFGTFPSNIYVFRVFLFSLIYQPHHLLTLPHHLTSRRKASTQGIHAFNMHRSGPNASPCTAMHGPAFISLAPLPLRGVGRGVAAAPRRPRRAPTMVWVERRASVVVEVGRAEVFESYVDLERMPEWSPWLKTVAVDARDPDVSTWTLAARGLQVAWRARNTAVERGRLIAWKSESGLPNRGSVTFEQAPGKSPRTCVTLAVEFDVPKQVKRAVESDFIGSFVEKTLLADLKRFRSIVLRRHRTILM